MTADSDNSTVLLLKIWTPNPFGVGLVRQTESDELYVHGLLIIIGLRFIPSHKTAYTKPISWKHLSFTKAFLHNLNAWK